MTERECLQWIADHPLTSEFNHAQAQAMHQFMLGWRNYDGMITVARRVLGERSDDAGDDPAVRPAGA